MKKMILDWQEYADIARQMVGEGTVLLKNERGTLPYAKGTKLSVFGRIQLHYYKSGTGSGGMVNVSHVAGITEALREGGDVLLNNRLEDIYRTWEETHPIQEGCGWGTEPWSQEEMPVTKEMVTEAARFSEHALIIIGRTAGEDQDIRNEEGSFLYTATEREMMRLVREAFPYVTVALNVGGLMDVGFLDELQPDALLYAWHGGMMGGFGAADVLTGKVNPSGHLTDTIPYALSDHPAYQNFGDRVRNFYKEDIYVGYRYFETFAKDKVRYPFGYGLSYTKFEMKATAAIDDCDIKIAVEVKNIGTCAGKEVVQIYASNPQGKLGKPARTLIGFMKTDLLEAGGTQKAEIIIPWSQLASYDETGLTGFRSAWVLEAGTYVFYVGDNIRSAVKISDYEQNETKLIQQCEEALAPVRAFERIKPAMLDDGSFDLQYEQTPLRTVDMAKRRLERRPEALRDSVGGFVTLKDVRENRADLDSLIAQLSEEELSCIIRGEGMGSPRVTPGTAAAFGGVSDGLTARDIPAGCCADGPSGMRLDTGVHAFSLPIGTLLACSFNTKLAEALYAQTGIEMCKNRIDILLAPGMNIHRYPLNGRNFEYFSEDPLITGRMAVAMLKGLQKAGVTGAVKHFCGNNQETGRLEVDSVISERALREIYLKGFEMAVKEGGATSVMSTYGSLNGQWTAGCYDLNTTVLRKEWGFTGFEMTDWFADISDGTEPQRKNNFAAMVRSQNDVYMVCPDGSTNSLNDNTLSALCDQTLTLGELQLCAKNICQFLLHTHAMERLCGEAVEVEVLNQPAEDANEEEFNVEYHEFTDEIIIPLDQVNTTKGATFSFALIVNHLGEYEVALTAASDAGEVAQMAVTLTFTSIPIAQFQWTGTNGAWVERKSTARLDTRYTVYKFYFAQSGLKLRDIRFTRIND